VTPTDTITITLSSGAVIELPAGSTLDEIAAAVTRLQQRGGDMSVSDFRPDDSLPENVWPIRREIS
jgi:hypothetical protein